MYNKATLVGNAGKDAELRYTAAGTAVASFSLATSEKFKDKSGEVREDTQWHNIVLWGRLAEIAGEYVTKGKTVLIEGKITTRKYQDRDGKDRYTTEIVANAMKLLGGKSNGSAGRGEERHDTGTGYEEPGFNPGFEEDIPF